MKIRIARAQFRAPRPADHPGAWRLAQVFARALERGAATPRSASKNTRKR